MDDPARLAAWRCVQFNCHNGIWNEIGAMWCWKGCRNIHFGSLAFTLGRENFSKSLCRQCQLSLRTPRIAGDAFVLVGSGKASPWSDLTPWGCECGKVGHASFRTSKRRGEQGLAQRKCWASCPQKLILGSDYNEGQCFLQFQWLSSRWSGTGGMMLAAPLHRDHGVRVTGASMSLSPGCSSCFLPSQAWNLLLLTDKSFYAENFLFI